MYKSSTTKIKLYVLLGTLVTLVSGNLYSQDLENIRKQKPFEIHGSLSTSGGYYHSVGLYNSRRPGTYSLMAAPTISTFGIDIPFNFTYTQGSRAISNPFSQFGMNPNWKWVKTYLGWTNMNWSSSTLGGKTFKGAGLELTPGKFRFGIFGGNLNPPVKEGLGEYIIEPEYKRIGMGVKLGIGTEKNYFDLIILKGKDKANSIPVPKDSLNLLYYTPSENLVVGGKNLFTFAKGRLQWLTEGAVSAFTRNTNSEKIEIPEELGLGFINKIFAPTNSSGLSWNVHTNLLYRTKISTLGFDYSRIEPDYQSMGVDYILNDQEKVTLNQTISLGKGKVNIAMNELYQRDNLNHRKSLQTNRAGGGFNMNWQANSKLGLLLNYNTYYVYQSDGLKKVNDTTKIAQTQNSFVLTPTYIISNAEIMQMFFSSISYTSINDLNRFTAKYSNNSTLIINMGYNRTYIKKQLGISPNISILNSNSAFFRYFNINSSVTASKSFFKGKSNTAATMGFVTAKQNGKWNSKTINNTLSAGYIIKNKHTFRFVNSIMYSWVMSSSTQEYRGEIVYSYNF